ncbi:R3H domain protein [Pelotomaculum schinkii]|uniref:RNA-binding protein KhpB n=1 Tax=Pelotomaculum schinkii TaxID=78350 RepID=A0A4Y7R5W8_9FIRM|nr:MULTISPECIES: RNA-binding cell elongation regulator Jag/EloR [Pelotomaculum]TEB04143.1 R3H domain protein [Pelotomaculum schinkii]TEB17841.1 R3H domain protein [Pelotomaculum sp. FP]
MKAVEKTGKTVDDAVSQALIDLGASREEVEVTVLDEPSKGIFGIFGAKMARVMVSLKNGPSQKATNLLKNIFRAMQIQVGIKANEKDHEIQINLEGDDLGILIGRRGETLDSLQYLVNLSVNKNQEVRKKIIIDIEGYRRRREETLQKLALKLADKAKQRGRNVVLEPMSSQERRIIHTVLQGRDDIYTFSEGEEPLRKIIIAPKK